MGCNFPLKVGRELRFLREWKILSEEIRGTECPMSNVQHGIPNEQLKALGFVGPMG